DRPRLRVDEELGELARGQPAPVDLRDRHDVGGLAVDRDLPRPRERPAARLVRRPIWGRRDSHLPPPARPPTPPRARIPPTNRFLTTPISSPAGERIAWKTFRATSGHSSHVTG